MAHQHGNKAAISAGDRAIVDTLYTIARFPDNPTQHPRPEMFRQRYARPEFQGRYGWV